MTENQYNFNAWAWTDTTDVVNHIPPSDQLSEPDPNYNKQKSFTDRSNMITLHGAGISKTLISEQLGINYETVRRIIKKYEETGSMAPERHGTNRLPKLNEEDKIYIREVVDNDCTLTLGEIRQNVIEERQKTVSISTINRALKEFHYTLKRTTESPVARNSDENIERRSAYATYFFNRQRVVSDTNYFFVDEVGFNIVSRRKYGRSLSGTSAVNELPGIRSKNITVFAAINRSGFKFFKVCESSMTSEKYKEVMLELKAAVTAAGYSTPIYFQDNARPHTSRDMVDFWRENRMEVKSIPPYSPFLNPIENAFSVWKNEVKKSNCLNRIQLNAAINTGFDAITSAKCDRFFLHMLQNLGICLEEVPMYE